MAERCGSVRTSPLTASPVAPGAECQKLTPKGVGDQRDAQCAVGAQHLTPDAHGVEEEPRNVSQALQLKPGRHDDDGLARRLR